MGPRALVALVVLGGALGAWSACSSDAAREEEPAVDASTVDVASPAVDAASPVDGGEDVTDASPASADCPDAGASLGAPKDLRCTGLYAPGPSSTIASDVREYAPAHPLWSDSAEKTRWVRLPPGQKIDTSDMDEWTFPVGTKFWKQFVLGGKKIETRFLWKVDASTWLKTTYKWDAAESTATRFDSGEWPGASGGDAGAYEIPSAAKCSQCHGGRKDQVLGFEAVNLGLPGATGITLASLVSDGLLTNPPPATSLTIPEDTTGVAGPALGWLHSNCGITCHSKSPGASCGFKGMVLRLAYDELHPSDGGAASVKSLKAYTTTYEVTASLAPAPDKRIAHGNPSGSAISYLIGRRDPTNANGQMPPLASHQVDTAHVDAVNAWISALP